jgi:hypothetical protein
VIALLAGLVLALNLVVWGAHAVLPFRLAGAEARRIWSRAALPALGLSVVATLALVSRRPDAAASWGLSGFVHGSASARFLVVAAAALAVADLLLLLGGDRLDAREWRLVGVFGALGLFAQTLGSELVRMGAGPAPGWTPLLAATLLRLPLALAAAELLTGPPRLWTPVSGPALALAFWLWPLGLRAVLGPDLLTLGAAVLLLTGARWLPPSLRRWGAVAGLALAVVFLVRAGGVSELLGERETLPFDLLSP